MKNIKEHDNIDKDVIKINKDSLTLKIQRCKDFYISSSSAFGFGGVAIALFLGGYLTETFHDIGFIPGETVRAIFIALALIFGGFTIKSIFDWIKLKDDHEPHQIVNSLLKEDSVEGPGLTDSNRRDRR